MTSDRLVQFTNDSLTFDVVDSGPLDGIPVVLLHGFPLRSSSWDEVVGLLHERGYRTYAPDQRGYSPGARPRGRWAYRMSKLVGDTVALISAIDSGPVHLIGHDWGATVAWSTAAQRPELLQTLTTLAVPHSSAFLRSMLSSKQFFLSYYMGLFQIPVVPELFFRRRPDAVKKLSMESGMTEEMVAEFREEIVDGGALTGSLNWYRALWIIGPRTGRRKVSVPTSHIFGAEDAALTLRGAELTAKYVTGPYDLCVLEGVSHWIPEEAAADVVGIFDTAARSER
ncbi:MAG: alpha/beta fold hydrolase [Aeromicrobium sp.]